MFITAEDFNVLPYRLPDLDENEEFSDFVQAEEIDRLRKILGRSLFDAFIAACFVLTDGVYTAKDNEDIDQRWLDLRDGAEYAYCDVVYNWQGVVKALKPYIFSKWITYSTEEFKGVGVVIPNTENATVVSPAGTIVRAFNEFSLLVGNECRMEDTLYGYLYNSEEAFTDSIGDETSIQVYLVRRFQNPGSMNIFNL